MKTLSLVGAAITAITVWSLSDDKLPPGVTPEPPLEYGVFPHRDIDNPFGQTSADDEENDHFLEAIKNPAQASATTSIHSSFLGEFAGPQRELLLRHLATSAKWFLGKNIVRGKEVSTARRRYVLGGMWQNTTGGFFSAPGRNWRIHEALQFRILLGIDGPVDAERWSDIATFSHAGRQMVQLKVQPDSAGGGTNSSYLVVDSAGAALEVYEQSRRGDRPFTQLALSELKDEFGAVLSSPIAKDRGFDPALLPKESIRRGSPEMHLINYMEDEGTYQVYAYLNPGEKGCVYLKVFEGGSKTRVSDDNYYKINSTEYTGWSTDSQEQFFYNTEFVVADAWRLSNKLPARFEIWFVPASGAAERKLMEKYFYVKDPL